MQVALSLRAKGIRGLSARVGTIVSRFGATPTRMERCLDRYVDLTSEFSVRPSLPITACVLARHALLIHRFSDRGVEFAIHGLVHNDHTTLGYDGQRTSISRAAEIFEQAGIPCVGFRGPYLRYSAATDDAVRDLGLRYHSSQAVAFPALPPAVIQGLGGRAYQRALELYGAWDASEVAVRPRLRQGLVEIPVAIPDDEIMVDRLHLDGEAQAAVWTSMLESTYTRGDLFTVQLHPERIFDSGHALEAILREAARRRPRIWTARMDEVATWWLERQSAILRVQQSREGCYEIQLEGSRRCTLLVRGLPEVVGAPWDDRTTVAQSPLFRVTCVVRPVVGLSARSPRSAHEFLREEGFLTETSDDAVLYGAYIDVPESGFDELRLLAEIERSQGPLVRLWRWPAEARSAVAVTGDIDSITLQDFALRLWETRRSGTVVVRRS